MVNSKPLALPPEHHRAAIAAPAATGIDLTEPALETVRETARGRGLSARLLGHDAVRRADLDETFDTVTAQLSSPAWRQCQVIAGAISCSASVIVHLKVVLIS
jgi:hypothetical protein